MRPVVEAAGCLLFTRTVPKLFLLMKHADRWDLPKGHAEVGEDALTTALRETEEETGIPADCIQIDPDFRYVVEYAVSGKKRGDYLKRVTFFLGFVDQCQDVQLSEHLGYEWLSWPVSGSIQPRTIDPLLAAVDVHWQRDSSV